MILNTASPSVYIYCPRRRHIHRSQISLSSYHHLVALILEYLSPCFDYVPQRRTALPRADGPGPQNQTSRRGESETSRRARASRCRHTNPFDGQSPLRELSACLRSSYKYSQADVGRSSHRYGGKSFCTGDIICYQTLSLFVYAYFINIGSCISVDRTCP